MFLVDMFVVSDLVLVVGCLMIRIAPVFVFNWSLEALYTQVVHHTVILLSSFLNLKKNNLAEGLIHKFTILLKTSTRKTIASSILDIAQSNLPSFISMFITNKRYKSVMRFDDNTQLNSKRDEPQRVAHELR